MSEEYCCRVRLVGGGKGSNDVNLERQERTRAAVIRMQCLARGRLGRMYAWAVRWLDDSFHQSVVLARSEELRSVVQIEKLPTILREMGFISFEVRHGSVGTAASTQTEREQSTRKRSRLFGRVRESASFRRVK